MDEEKSTDESPRVSSKPPATIELDDVNASGIELAEEKVKSVDKSDKSTPHSDENEISSELNSAQNELQNSQKTSEAENHNSKNVEDEVNKHFIVAVDDETTKKTRNDDEDDPHEKPLETQKKTQNENENKNENDKINSASDESINKTVSSSNDDSKTNLNTNLPNIAIPTSTTPPKTSDETRNQIVTSNCSTLKISSTTSASTISTAVEESKTDVKLEIDSSSLLDRVILYSLKNTVVDNSRLDAVKTRYLNNTTSGSSSTLPNNIINNNNSQQTNNISNKGSDINSCNSQQQQSNSKSVNEVIEEFKSCSKMNYNNNNRTFTSDKSDRHDEPSTKGAEKVYISNDSNIVTKENVARENERRECDKNVIFIPKGAERSSSYKRDFISENPPLPPPHFPVPPHVKRVEPETHSAYKFNNPVQHQQQRPLNTYDNNYHTNTNRHSLQERIVNENSFLKRDPTSLSSMSTASLMQQRRDEEKTVIKQSRAPCMRLPDFSKRNFDTSSSASVKNRVAVVSTVNPTTMHYENAVYMEAQQMKNITKEPSTSTPPLSSLKMHTPDFAEVIRRNNYIADLQLKPSSETSTMTSATKYSYSHTPPPLHYNDSNYSPSPYHFNHHPHARSSQQPHIAPSLSRMPTATHKTPTSSYEIPPARESLQLDEPMAHIINKSHHLIALKGEPSSQSQHNLMRANESGMKSIYSSSLPPHHQTPPPQLQSHPNHHVLNNSHNQTVSVIRDSATMRDSHQQQQEHERRMRIDNYTNELRNHPAESPPHFYANPSHSFSLKQKEDQLRQEGTIITLKTELNIVRNYDDRRSSSTEVIREIHQSKPHESLDIRRTTYHISHQGYHPQPHHGQESNYKHDNDPRVKMLASPRHEINPISSPQYYNNSSSNERYPTATTVNPLRSAMNRFGNSNELQVYDKQCQMIGRSKTTNSGEYQQLRREFVQPHPPPPSSNFMNSRFTSQIPPQQNHPTTDYRNLPDGYPLPYPRPPPVVPVVNNYPQSSPTAERNSSVLRVNKEVKFVPEAPNDPLPSTSTMTTVVKKESPLDLSVKTVKTKADSTGCDQDKKSMEAKSLKIEFNPDFSRAAVAPPAPVNFSMNKMRPAVINTSKSHEISYQNESDMKTAPYFPSAIASYENSPRILSNSSTISQDHGKPLISKIEPVNGLNVPHSPFFQPPQSSSSSSPHPIPPQLEKRPPLQFKEEMFSKKTPTPYRKPFSRISLEEERKLDRMYVEQMLHGKGAGREPPPPPPSHRFPHKHPLDRPVEMSRMMPPKAFVEPLQPKDQFIPITKPQQHLPPIHHYQNHVIPSDFSKEIIERQFVNSETRLEPVILHSSPPIPYHQNITVKTETEKFVDENIAKVTSVITKSTTNITVSPTTSTHEPGNSIHRGAEESTILKLKTNLEQKKIMLSKNEVSEYQEQMQTATTTPAPSMMSTNENNNAAVVSPRQFRTKGELKGFVQPNESINLLDWGNACHGFMQQLETGGKSSTNSKKKRPLKSTNENKTLTSDDEDKPLVKLFKKEDDESITTATATVTSAEGNSRQFREMQRIELERRIAARLGNPSSSESESELKKSSIRTKRRIRKLRKRETLGMKKTDEEQTFEEIESDVATLNHVKPSKHSKLDNLTSSDEDETGENAADPTSKRKKECQERRSSRSSVSNSGKKKEAPRNPQTTSSGASKTPTSKTSSESKPANDLKQLGISSELGNLINEGETMTRSKRKLEIEKKLSNSKVLRNDKVVRNDLCVKKIRNVSNNVNKVATTKKSDSPKRKVDETDSKEAVDKKKLKKNESQSTNDSSDSENQKSDTEQ